MVGEERRGCTVSVIIPAHNEEQVIAACLAALLDGASPGELEVIVVANGCTDRTAALARGAGADVTVLESGVASKSQALNLGDDVATAWPRIYLDADIELRVNAVRRVVAALARREPLVAAPRIRIDVAGRRWPVRAYYEIWMQLPYLTQSHVGAGVFALNEAGRARFERFPDLITDDLYVQRLFSPHERVPVPDCEFVVRAPTTLGGIVRIRGRSSAGIRQLAQRFPELVARAKVEDEPRAARFGALARSPRRWPSLAAYVAVYVRSEIRGWWKFRFGDLDRWEVDRTARAVPVSR